MSAAGPIQIDVGTARSDGTLRRWLAQQAVAQGEAVLAAQIAAVTRLSTGATSILGWSVTISLALVAGISSSLVAAAGSSGPASSIFPSHLLWPAILALVSTLGAAVCCLIVLWSGYWRPPAHAPDLVLNAPYDTELEVLEALAIGYADAMHENARKLTVLEQWLRAAWVSFIACPVVGMATYMTQTFGVIAWIFSAHA